MPSVPSIIESYLPEVKAFRRDLHRNPEPGYQEFETSRKIIERLRACGSFTIETSVATTGVVATLVPEKPGRGIALRADMDCLPIKETSGVEWASTKPGWMHACGHDGHTSCLLGTALVLAEFQDLLEGPVKFIFQPAEEGGAGGRKMVEAGVLEQPAVDMVFGLHGWPGLRLGTIASCSGSMMANADAFKIIVHGKGGHAAYPHQFNNPIPAAAAVISALEPLTTAPSAKGNARVVTVGKVDGGTAFNIIPDSVTLLGTIRTLTAEERESVFEKITNYSEKAARNFGARTEVHISRGYPVLSNDPNAFRYLKEILTHMDNPVEHIEGLFPQMVGEDFAYFAEEKPSCFFGLGLKPEGVDPYPQLHQSDFDFNDDALPLGMRCFTELVLNFWKEPSAVSR